jgi:hypothetical protein
MNPFIGISVSVEDDPLVLLKRVLDKIMYCGLQFICRHILQYLIEV